MLKYREKQPSFSWRKSTGHLERSKLYETSQISCSNNNWPHLQETTVSTFNILHYKVLFQRFKLSSLGTVKRYLHSLHIVPHLKSHSSIYNSSHSVTYHDVTHVAIMQIITQNNAS